MSVIVEGIRSSGQLTGTGDQTSFLADNQSGILTVEIDVRVENYMIPVSDDKDSGEYFMMVDAFSSLTGKVRDDRTVHTTNPLGFPENEYKVGDTWVTVGFTAFPANNTTGTILEISDDRRTIITDHNFSPELFPLDAYFAITTPITAITHKHGLIENEEPINYNSKVDGSEQVAQLGGLDYTNTVYQTATMLGNKSWQSGNIQMKGNNIGNGDPSLVAGVIQAFTIKHELVINPLMLADQWDNILQRIKPEWLIDGASLRYVTSVDLSPELKNPNVTTNVTYGETQLGNFGWFDENLNGGPSGYTYGNLVFKNTLDEITDGFELTDNESKIQFKVFSSEGTFSASNTQMIFGFNFAPADESQYRDVTLATSQTMEYNFMFDNVLTTLGQASGTPRHFGTDQQIIKTMEATIVSNFEIDVEVIIDFSTEILSRIAASVDKRFMIYFETGNYLLSRSESDKVNQLIDADDFFIDFADPGMIVMDSNFLEFPFSDISSDLTPTINGSLEDHLLGVNSFYLDKVTRESDDIIFTGITSQIIARKTTGASFVLDSSNNIVLTGVDRVGNAVYGAIPTPKIVNPRGFKTPPDDQRNNIRLYRDYDSDSGGKFYYLSQFPFKIRWEDYVALSPVNDEFFNPDEPNDGKNQDWNRYDATPDWNIYYQTILTATKNGNPLTFEDLKIVNTFDYTEGDQWDTEVINFFDENDDALVNGPTKYIIKSINTKVESDFTYIGPAPNPSISDLVIVHKIYVFQQGTFLSSYELSSAYDAHPSTWWKSIDSSDRVVVTDEGGGVFRGTSLIQGSMLPDELEFQVTARIYDKRDAIPPGPPAIPKLMEDGTPKVMDGSTTFKLME